MPRLTTPYTHETPILRLAITGPHRPFALAGVVDSGADRTLLPLSVARSLGFPDTDLIPTPDGSGGAGNMWFPTWELPHSIKAHVIVPFPAPRGVELWGPELTLNPEWAKDTVALFGRADFFDAFVVTFDQKRTDGPEFHLDYPN
jgi:hypothetical protein